MNYLEIILQLAQSGVLLTAEAASPQETLLHGAVALIRDGAGVHWRDDG